MSMQEILTSLSLSLIIRSDCKAGSAEMSIRSAIHAGSFAAFALVLISCNGGGEQPPSPDIGANEAEPTFHDTQPDRPAIGGGDGPAYEEPIPVTDGDYEFPVGADLQEARDRASAAFAASGAPVSTEVAGIRLAPTSERSSEAFQQKRCDFSDFPLAEHLKFSYLPPGTYLQSPQYERRCADGSLGSVVQEFVTRRGGLHVEFDPDEPILFYDAPQGRVHEVPVNGAEALVIDPLVPEGLGPSLAAKKLGSGFVFISASDLPTAELIQMLGGIECDDC